MDVRAWRLKDDNYWLIWQLCNDPPPSGDEPSITLCTNLSRIMARLQWDNDVETSWLNTIIHNMRQSPRVAVSEMLKGMILLQKMGYSMLEKGIHSTLCQRRPNLTLIYLRYWGKARPSAFLGASVRQQEHLLLPYNGGRTASRSHSW